MTTDDPAPTYFDIVEPHPVEPPSYQSTLPRVQRPSYDTMEPFNEPLPGYSPTSYKIGVLYRKLEWTSPLELSQQRQWKPFIFELNNTQLNIYQYPKELQVDTLIQTGNSFSGKNSHTMLHPYHYHHLHLRRLQGVVCPTAVKDGEMLDYNEENYRSVMTTKNDLRALKYFKSLHALEQIKIVRSYSLQYGRIGLAIDYKKKVRVFRCRFESEQFLMEFENTEGMIEWFNALNLGIDNALDINRREMPTYRTIPRRRRRVRVRSSSVHDLTRNVAFGFGLSSLNESSTNGGGNKTNSGHRRKSSGGFSVLKNKLFGSGSSSTNKLAEQQPNNNSTGELDMFQVIHQPDEPDHIEEELELDEDGFEVERHEDDDDEEDDEEEFEIEPHVEAPGESGDVSDDDPETHVVNSRIRRESSTYVGVYVPESYTLRSYTEYIAKPTRTCTKHTYPQQRKVLRDSLRCMPPLTENDRWIGRYIVLDYDPKYVPQSQRDVERHFASMEVKTHIIKVGSQYVHHWKRPLQEWIVTPSGLMPYLNESWNR